jgi:tRNA1Val (adenine37-N6)-methyltransferase
MNKKTADKIKHLDLQIDQPQNGYRFSIDALLLADFAQPPANAKVADLGTGSGVIPLLLARQAAGISISGVESNPEMADLASRNVFSNNLEKRIEIIADDLLNLRSRFPVSSFDLVVSNPPYRTPASGRTSPKPGRDTARHESTATIADFLAIAKYLVKPTGRICFVYHPARLTEFIRIAGELNLALLRIRMVHGSLDAPARIFLAELAKGRKGDTKVLPPLLIYNNDGTYTDEASLITGQTHR